MNSQAVKNIFAAKGRPSDNPLIVHISDIAMLDGIVDGVPDNAKKLMDKFWPGPLTIIMKKCPSVPYETTGGLDTVAVRMPKSDIARQLIGYAEIPIAAPSANLSGKPSPTSAKHCVEDMTGRVDAIISGDDCEVGVESTVIDMSADIPVLLRPGGVTLEQLREVLGEVEIVNGHTDKPKSPGMKYRHYAPKAEVYIVSGSVDDVQRMIDNNPDRKTGMLVFDEFPVFKGAKCIWHGSRNNPEEAAKRLFGALRDMDELGVDVIFAPAIPESGVWRAVRNRLYRAASERVIDLSVTDKIDNTPKKILFVCTGNTCRSPMAEAIFNTLAKKEGINAKASSAGIYAGGVLSDNSDEVLSEIGINISGRPAVQLDASLVDNADLILTMSASHKSVIRNVFGVEDKVKTLGDYCSGGEDIADPFGGDIEVYRACRDEIYELLRRAVLKIGGR